MTNLELFFIGLGGIFKNYWPALLYFVLMIPRLRRWERDEEKRMAQAVKRDNLKREHNQEYTASRY